MGYQAESGPWRNFYLSGAKELRDGVVAAATVSTGSPDILRALPLSTYLDFIAVRLNHPKAAGKKITLNFVMPDVDEKATIIVKNGVMNYTIGKQADAADATVTIDRSVLDQINLGQTTLQKAIENGSVSVAGNKQKVEEFVGLLDTFQFWFNIVTP